MDYYAIAIGMAIDGLVRPAINVAIPSGNYVFLLPMQT